MVADPSIRVYSVMFENIRPNTIGMVSVDELQKEAANRINNLELAKAKRAKQGNTQGKGGGKGGGKGKGNGAGGKGRGGIPARGRRAQFPPRAFNDGHQEPFAGDRLDYQGYYEENPYQPIAPNQGYYDENPYQPIAPAAAAAPLLLLQADGATPQQEQD